MKKNMIVICSIILAVCIGLGIPLMTANIQDSAVLSKTESLVNADASLGLNGRGSTSLEDKYRLMSSELLYESELSSGKYMLADEVQARAEEYDEMLRLYGARSVDTKSDDYFSIMPRPLMIGDESGELPSIIVWRVLMHDADGIVEMMIDDETGMLLSLQYRDIEYLGRENAASIEPHFDIICTAAAELAAQSGAELVNVYEADDYISEYINLVYIELRFPVRESEQRENAQDGGVVKLMIELNNGMYAFNDMSSY